MNPPVAIDGQRSAQWVAALTLFALIAPHWLMTRDLADGSVLAFARAIGDPSGLFLWLANANWWLAIGYYKAIFGMSDVSGLGYLVFIKCTLSVLLVALYFECVCLARDVFKLPANEARFAALLCVASPCLYTLVNSSATVNLLCLWLVLAGHRLYWSDKVAIRWLGLVVLVLSFQINSNLVFALALDMVRLWLLKSQRKARWAWFLGLFVVAVCAYMTLRAISPPKQIFVEYNRLLNPFKPDDLRRILRATAMFLTWGAIPLMALLGVAVASLVLRNQQSAISSEKSSVRPWLGLALVLGFLAGAAAFPYAVVGKGPPLFTPTAYGNGLTEQVLRAAYSGPIAPTWANTSMRHGFLLSVPIGLLTWILGTALAQKLKMRFNPLALYALLLPLALVWVVPAYGNKLQNQWAEITLIKGFRTLPPAKAGIIELQYRPVSSWLIWTTNANMILREAWGQSNHLGFFYSVDAYRDDLYWQYHTYILDTGVLQSRLLQNAMAMDGFPGADCLTKYQVVWTDPTLSQMVLAGWFAGAVPAAAINQIQADCQPGRVLPNPNPDKKIIP